ncbi:hypothetical protein YC2023_107994 [Brassica napus]
MNATWLILPVVICLSQRLSHACDPLEGKSGASSRGNSSSNSLVVEPWDGSPGPPSVSTGRLVSSVGDTLLALTGRVVPPDFDPIVLAFGIGVMINRDSRYDNPPFGIKWSREQNSESRAELLGIKAIEGIYYKSEAGRELSRTKNKHDGIEARPENPKTRMGAEKYSGLIAGQKFTRRVEIAQRNREARGGLIRRDKNVVATV